MKILITAGGTVEKIDSVRSISNFSTGRLGSLIADAFSAVNEVDSIFYVCDKNAVHPQSAKSEIVYTDSVASLENTVSALLAENDIDVIIHSMAVSDYRVKSVTTASGAEIDRSGKIKSDMYELVITMERTPKVISMLKKLSPKSLIVGFKLLDSVPRETPIDAGHKLLIENKCDFVLANDLSEIDGDSHIGYLIDGEKNYGRFSTKQEIASEIVNAVIQKQRSAK